MTALELKIPPPIQALLTITGMWLTARYLPAFSFDLPWLTGLAITLATTGILCILAGVLAFRKAMTTVNPLNPDATSTLGLAPIRACLKESRGTPDAAMDNRI
nr:L414 [uncultured bacterium]